MKYALVQCNTAKYPVTMLCRVIGVKRSSYYAWRARGGKVIGPEELAVRRRMKSLFAESRQSMGSRRLSRQLTAEGFSIGRYRARQLMKSMGLAVKSKRKYKVTTDSKHRLPVADNVLNRAFSPAAPNQCWGTDITCLWTQEGWIYLAVVIDLYSRRVVGWSMDRRMTKALAIRALIMAVSLRNPPPGLIHHSDRGSQYASYAYQALLKQYGMIASMSRKGNCWDNAPVERFFSSLKREWTCDRIYRTREAAIADVREYVAVYYNAKRLHSTLGYKTPMDYEFNLSKVSKNSRPQQRWPATSLLDALKETDFRAGFTKAFATAASREATPPDEVLRRLLLSLYGLGTNAGLKCLASGPHGVSYKELLHTRRRYIHKDSLRDAIRRVVNATLQARLPHIWGEGTTACASDSTQFSAWDQNLMTEWHVRYGGRGVMIYWHVDINAVCIYSQLKRCSSSEVASMIEGVLHHCTEMEVERQYVDSHGQSVVAFAFCHLLGFTLMPRFKGINKLKLAQPDTGAKERYPNLEPIFTSKAINWELIAQQYDELVKFTTALRTRTAEADAILRRFTRSNVQHPTYAALIELGRAVKTIFLCNYLASEELRREVNTGLNVVERWNGVNSFIYFGKSGEMATNNLEDQEVSALALHLLQVSLVYINTLMIQQVLREPGWMNRMTERDMRALSPLPHSHFNPYGVFDLDMERRIPLDEMPLAA